MIKLIILVLSISLYFPQFSSYEGIFIDDRHPLIGHVNCFIILCKINILIKKHSNNLIYFYNNLSYLRFIPTIINAVLMLRLYFSSFLLSENKLNNVILRQRNMYYVVIK